MPTKKTRRMRVQVRKGGQGICTGPNVIKVNVTKPESTKKKQGTRENRALSTGARRGKGKRGNRVRSLHLHSNLGYGGRKDTEKETMLTVTLATSEGRL